ncbi:MAG: molybdopterin cofactor-binding domain-containing protein [Pseudomonadota bacterium]
MLKVTDNPHGTVSFTVNGQHTVTYPKATTALVDTLRDTLKLTGTHIGCQTARCGACTIELDGASVKACTVLTHQADGAIINTIEGVADGPKLDRVQEAFRAKHALQCGFCTPGMVMSVRELLRRNPNPTDDDIREGLKGNICRCTGYQNIVRAVRSLATEQRAIQSAAGGVTSIGAATPRKEDKRFLTGKGRYCADVDINRQLHATFVRSTVAQANIKSVDVSDALRIPGVAAVFTGADILADGLGDLGCGWMVRSRDGSPMRGGRRPILAHDRLRYVGDAYAIVLAETADIAKKAAKAVTAILESQPHNVDPLKADVSMPLHNEAANNLCFDWQFGDETGVEQALEKAAHTVEISLTNNRLIPNALEPRAAIADYYMGDETATLYTTSQNPHMARKVIAETVGFIGEHNLRVVSPDIGGGFGSKIFIYPEECAVLWASYKIGRPVKWVASREESFLCDAHGRDHRTTATLTLDADHRFLGMDVQTTANLGAYLSSFAAFVPTYLYGTMLAGPYRTPAVSCNVKGVFTNTAPVDAYRGAGRPEATYLLETIVDAAARQLGVDPVELRRKNLITPEEFPYQTPVALEYDSGNYQAHLDEALKAADYTGFQSRKSEAAARGHIRGIGVSCYVEACGIAPSAVAGALGADVGLWESALLRFTPTGALQVFTGSHSHGQGHETTFAQLVSEHFSLPIDKIRVLHGDTDNSPVGMGTYGSRSLAVGGSAILKAAEKLIEKGKRIAAHQLGVAVDEIEFEAGRFFARTSNEGLTLEEIVHAAYVPHDYPEDLEPGFEASAFYDPINFTYPSGTHVCEVEIDPQTGAVDIVNFVAVDDFGEIVNPLIVEGQVHGGVVQGIGQALFEEAIYNAETGQPETISYLDYALPRATHLNDIEVGSTFTPCEHNPVGAKGCGEAGAIAAPPAIMNAIANALGKRIEMPATPARIWAACQTVASEVESESRG